ncbi:MAG: hypothetical protein JZU47_22055 [Prolixibacteraceae bacterium]|nr:hypothetical protein [Prolixibacteraceae bacterium]
MNLQAIPIFLFAFSAFLSLNENKEKQGLPEIKVSQIQAITPEDSVILVSGNEQQKLNLDLPDGGLAPLPGVLNIELLRTTRDAPELADGDGWTYAHHMDLAEWRGRLYAAWNMTLKDEDVPPSKVVYATSENGMEWSKPADLFPRELAWACRFYFYHTKNDKMLAFCAARLGDGIVTEDLKSVLLVREIQADHQLGPVFTLIHPMEKLPPSFETSTDKAFVEACREAAGNNMLLEQQDYGVFLGDRKMKWHEQTPPYKGFYKFGKAFSFYQRQDQQWVGISKMGFVTHSADNGKNWAEPVLPSTLIAGSAKIWGQRTCDNRYILAYNPDPKRVKRFPLVMVNGDDGIHFKDMRVLHGEYPPLRYPGRYKDFGYQYVRGVAAWSSDGSFADKKSTWLIYSVHKEDIWLARIPLPINAEPNSFPADNFDKIPTGAIVPDWNLYSPKWAPVGIVEESGKKQNHCLELRDGDPTDYARAMRLFPSESAVNAQFRIKAFQTNAPIEIEFQDENGNAFVKISLTPDGFVKASADQNQLDLGKYNSGKWNSFQISADTKSGAVILRFNDKSVKFSGINNQAETKLQRLVFRTGPSRKLGDTDVLQGGKDKPLANPSVFLIDNVTVKKK